MTERKFGIELEFNGIERAQARQALIAGGIALGSRSWNLKTDCSVSGSGLELVSPILKGSAGIVAIRKVANILTRAGGKTDKSCGFHVHVDARDLNVPTIANVAARYAKFESQIDNFMVASRRQSKNSFTRSCKSCVTKTKIRNMLLNGFASYGNYSRYHKVNLAAFARHGTIEFRHHEGTLDAEKIVNWTKFCIAFVNASILSNDILPANPNDKINKMYKYLASAHRSAGGFLLHHKDVCYNDFNEIFASIRKCYGVSFNNSPGSNYITRVNRVTKGTRVLDKLPVMSDDAWYRGIESDVKAHLESRL